MSRVSMARLPELAPGARVLLVLKPTRIHAAFERTVAGAPAGEADVHALSRPRQLLMWKSHTQYLRANPRTTEYMLRLAYEWLERHAPDATADLLIDTRSADEVPVPVRAWLRHVRAVSERTLSRFDTSLRGTLHAAKYAAVFLLYRDGTGLGWRPLEREIARLDVPVTIALNGRTRAFPLTHDRLLTLRWRRFMETSWIAELALVPIMIVTALALWVYDALTPRRQRMVDGK